MDNTRKSSEQFDFNNDDITTLLKSIEAFNPDRSSSTIIHSQPNQSQPHESNHPNPHSHSIDFLISQLTHSSSTSLQQSHANPHVNSTAFLSSRDHTYSPTSSSLGFNKSTLENNSRLEPEVSRDLGGQNITPEMLRELWHLTEQPRFLATIQQLKQEQEKKEQQLFLSREKFVQKMEEFRNELFSKELRGQISKVKVKEKEKELNQRLQEFDKKVVMKVNRLIEHQQETLAKLGIPFFRITHQKEVIEKQQKILTLLLEMLPKTTE